ncbi:hypothetical protein BU17DRAFT_64867 [Hysterangium stoloniferum]|nr:hypothetical protein BU17DRAFT_64867 [Hysterangium stoloniferum]
MRSYDEKEKMQAGGFAKQGLRLEDSKTSAKIPERRKRKQYDRGIQKAHGSCNNWQWQRQKRSSLVQAAGPKTLTQSPEKEKETNRRHPRKAQGRRKRKRLGREQTQQDKRGQAYQRTRRSSPPTDISEPGAFSPSLPAFNVSFEGSGTPHAITTHRAYCNIQTGTVSARRGRWGQVCRQLCDGHWLGEDGGKWNDLISSNGEPINNALSYRGRWWLLRRSEIGGEGGFIDGKKTQVTMTTQWSPASTRAPLGGPPPYHSPQTVVSEDRTLSASVEGG